MTTGTTITIHLNGEVRELPTGLSITDLFALLEMRADAIIVEANATVVPRSTYDRHLIQDGDRLELMRLIGGG